MVNGFQYNMPNYYNQQNLIRVNGIDGAKAYQMQPNSTVALFDNTNDIMYVKTTDGAGFPTIRVFSFQEIEQENKQDLNKEYVTKEELIDYVQQFIQPTSTTNKSKSVQSRTD